MEVNDYLIDLKKSKAQLRNQMLKDELKKII
jgi:hypothetical protein